MELSKMEEKDFDRFYAMANAYYREGEDRDTPQNEIDDFIRLLFDMVTAGEIFGRFLKEEGADIGFALWAIDREGFAFSEMPGYGTILEFGILPPYRRAGRGRKFAQHIENCLYYNFVDNCYVLAYPPSQQFWTSCGYVPNGKTAKNGLPILVKSVLGEADDRA